MFEGGRMLGRAVSGAGCGDRRAWIGPGTSGDLLGRRGAAGACWPIVSSIDAFRSLIPPIPNFVRNAAARRWT